MCLKGGTISISLVVIEFSEGRRFDLGAQL